jgi:predicted  nucleic acid-binding Zn-ribbon protein
MPPFFEIEELCFLYFLTSMVYFNSPNHGTMEVKTKSKPKTKSKKMEVKTKSKPKTKSKKDLTKEKSSLTSDIKAKKAEIEVLNSKIGDLEKLSGKKDTLKTEVEELTQQKRELGQLTIQQQSLSKEIEVLKGEKKKLNTFIKNNTPKKDTLESELTELEEKKLDLNGKVEILMQNGKKAQATVTHLKEEKEKYEASISELKNEYKLFPRDLKEMSKDSVSQLKKYSSLATLSIIGGLLIMGLLTALLILPIIDNAFAGISAGLPVGYGFYSILTTKILISAALIFFILIFVSLTRGFISQYIKSRNRLSSLRIADYLIDRVQAKESQNGKEEIDLLQTYLPKIMDMENSSFDKPSK